MADINVNVPSLSELSYALQQRKNFSDVLNQAQAGKAQGMAQANESAKTVAELLKTRAEIEKLKHEANKPYETDMVPVASYKDMLTPTQFKAVQIMAGPSGLLHKDQLTPLISIVKEGGTEKRTQAQIDAANQREQDRLDAQSGLAASKEQFEAAKLTKAGYDKKSLFGKGIANIFNTDEHKAAVKADEVLKKRLEGTTKSGAQYRVVE